MLSSMSKAHDVGKGTKDGTAHIMEKYITVKVYMLYYHYIRGKSSKNFKIGSIVKSGKRLTRDLRNLFVNSMEEGEVRDYANCKGIRVELPINRAYH